MTEPKALMRRQARWFWPAWFPIIAGLLWLALGWRAGIVAGLFASLPGALLLGPGIALLLWPGDRQISHIMALTGVGSLLFALPMFFFVGIFPGLLLLLLGAANFVLAGYAAVVQSATVAGVPPADNTLRMAVKVALDEAILAYFVTSARVPVGAQVDSELSELKALADAVAANDWVQSPHKLHPPPPPPGDDRIEARRAAGENFLHLRFASGYTPHPAVPGGERWLRPSANREVHAWVFRHADRPRPWLIGIHGYRMGAPWIDFSLFDVQWLHRRLGFNMILPILPLHGPRTVYRRSGSGYLDGPLVDILHAEAQALWDIRRCMAWLRAREGDPDMAVLGFSLGGYNAALLAAFEPQLQCAIAGIPVTDMAAIVWRHLPLLHRRYIESRGLTVDMARAALAPVSPLVLAPAIARQRRFIFAAAGDQLVAPEHTVWLQQHWQAPKTLWYQGAHLSVRGEPQVAPFIESAFAASGFSAASACSQALQAGQ